jgi:broad specificity phosphatase PhoE
MSRRDEEREFRLDAPMDDISIMRIILMRHGEPALQPSLWITGHEFGEWVQSFDRGGIDDAMVVPEQVQRLASTIGWVIASDLPRATQSAARLAGVRLARGLVIDPNLREARLMQSFPTSLRAPASLWLRVARLAWWLDITSSPEPIAAARHRAKRVTNKLVSLALEHHSVLVIGHGTFNALLARRLRRLGWAGPLLPPSRYWSVATYKAPHSKPR